MISDSIFDVKNELFMKMMDDIQRTINRYKRFDSEQRFLMLTDKLVLMFTFGSSAFIMANQHRIDTIDTDKTLTDEQKLAQKKEILEQFNKVSDIFDMIKGELFALEDFIQSDTKSILNKVDNKLDEVLMGPYYAAGKELMANAGKDFSQNL